MLSAQIEIYIRDWWSAASVLAVSVMKASVVYVFCVGLTISKQTSEWSELSLWKIELLCV